MTTAAASGARRKADSRDMAAGLVREKRLALCADLLPMAYVSWGANFHHELDLLSVSKAGYGTETDAEIQNPLRLGNTRFWSLLRHEILNAEDEREGDDGNA
jgi:hypothetical protein